MNSQEKKKKVRIYEFFYLDLKIKICYIVTLSILNIFVAFFEILLFGDSP